MSCLALGSLVVLAAPVTTYWLVGDLSSPGLSPTNADYVTRPPDWSAAAVREAGVGALVVGIVTLALLGLAVWKRLLRWEWLTVVGMSAASLSILAVGYRIATAAVIGANMGIGFFMMFGLPVCVGLVIWAGTIIRKLVSAVPPGSAFDA